MMNEMDARVAAWAAIAEAMKLGHRSRMELQDFLMATALFNKLVGNDEQPAEV